jgi:hypothetical protein
VLQVSAVGLGFQGVAQSLLDLRVVELAAPHRWISARRRQREELERG